MNFEAKLNLKKDGEKFGITNHGNDSLETKNQEKIFFKEKLDMRKSI